MKKLIAILLTLSMCFVLAGALAEGVTIKTVSTFAGTDAAADQYLSLLRAWEEKTGNKVEDSSATSDEAWKTGVLNDFAAGNEADVLFYFAKTADSAPILDKVVPIGEINAAYPDAMLTENSAIAESDGSIYAIPVRAFWEGLFVNVDLFEKYDLELPTDWAKLEAAIKVFNENDIVPIAVSLSDIPHYIVEFAILASGSVESHLARPAKGETVPQSWVDGMKLINKLYQLGAFVKDVNATTEAVTSQMFKDKKAAMQLDGSWFANGIPAESMDSTIVIPFPVASPEADSTAFIGGVSMGFYLSRKAWDDASKRDAAVDLLKFLTTGENAQALGGYAFTGRLLESSYDMINNAGAMNGPFQDVMDPEARSVWFSAVPDMAEGTADPAAVWAQVMEKDPFAAK